MLCCIIWQQQRLIAIRLRRGKTLMQLVSLEETQQKLLDLLAKSTAVVECRQRFRARNRVLCVLATDIDNDGDREIIVSAADGRLTVLSKDCEVRWSCIVGDKSPVKTLAILPYKGHKEAPHTSHLIMVGTESGYLYAFNKYGQTISKDGTVNPFSKEGTINTERIDGESDKSSYWFSGEGAINQISITPQEPYDIIMASEDRYVYALHSDTGEASWQPFQTKGWARGVLTCDLNNDGTSETLISSANGDLYLLDYQGQQIDVRVMEHPVRALFVADINADGINEILAATDKKDLIALTPDFKCLWMNEEFGSRLRALTVVDLDGDGSKEIITGGDDKYLSILNARGQIIWRYFLGTRIASICTCDLDGDGIQEIIIGADDEGVHVLHINLVWVKESLYTQLRKTLLSGHSLDLPDRINPSVRQLVRDIMHVKRDEPILLDRAEELFQQGHFEQALVVFLQLRQQRVQVLWQRQTGYESRILCFGNVLGTLIAGTADGMLRAYDSTGHDLWSRQLPSQILSAQIGRIQGPGLEDILVCSTDRQIYLIGYETSSVIGKKTVAPDILRDYEIDPLISSVALKPGFRNTEIVFGSESQKIYVYRNGLEASAECISTRQGVRHIQLCHAKFNNYRAPDIIAARTDHSVVAYNYSQIDELWSFKARNRIRALAVRDIDGDNHDEIIIGSEDRNIHVVDDEGRLKWRYYLPYSVLSTHVVDIDQDGRLEVLAGCADGYLYVFDKDGDLLWKYQIDERITAIASRENEGVVEIVLGTESRVSLLQVIDQTYLQDAIERCWQAITQGGCEEQVARDLVLMTEEPLLRAFALQKVISLQSCMNNKLEFFNRFAKDASIEVRKTLVRALMDGYNSYPTEIRQLLEIFSADQDREVRLTLVEHIDQLMQYDWAMGFDYLERFSGNLDRFVRRAVVRKLYSLIQDSEEMQSKKIFHLLLKGACDQYSEWVRQETARTLAHFLDHHPWEILRNIYYFISRGVNQVILLHIADHATVPTVRETVQALVCLMQDDLNMDNASERLAATVQALHRIQESKFGEDAWLLYKTLYDLFNLHTIRDIAHYQSTLKTYQPDQENDHFIIVARVLEAIPNVTRILKIYLQRQNTNDQIAGLQDAYKAIERLDHFLDNEYRSLIRNEYNLPTHHQPMKQFPDHRFLKLLFARWHTLLQTTLNDLRGKPEIIANLLTGQLYYEGKVSILLKIQNIGRSPAYAIRVDLLHSEAFTVIPHASIQTDILFHNGVLRAEFTIKFNAYQDCVDLDFEITYDDSEKGFCKKTITIPLIVRLMDTSDYEFVPNPYSTGTPVNDNAMFFGRARDIEVLKRELTLNTAQRIIVLHGLRRSGKTSLLRYLVKNNLLDNCIPIYIDMQNIVHEITTSRFFYRMAYHIQRTVAKKKHIQLPLPLPAIFQDDPTLIFDSFLDEVEACLPGEKIVLLIDEFEILQEQTEQGQLKPTLFSYLRSLMQHRNMNFLLAGTHKLEQLATEYWAVFYNLALPYRLSKISEQGAYSLITQPVASHLTYDPFAIEKIRQLAGDQPFLLHSLCRILVDQCNDLRKSYITLHDVNALLPHAIMINSIQFSSLWQLIEPEEQLALAAIAHGGRERPLSFMEIEYVYRAERIPYEPQLLRDALGSLTQQDLLEGVMDDEQEELRYHIPIGLLRIWLTQEQSLTALKLRQKNLQ
jgi:outer membrane protein assembly factor BamB